MSGDQKYPQPIKSALGVELNSPLTVYEGPAKMDGQDIALSIVWLNDSTLELHAEVEYGIFSFDTHDPSMSDKTIQVPGFEPVKAFITRYAPGQNAVNIHMATNAVQALHTQVDKMQFHAVNSPKWMGLPVAWRRGFARSRLQLDSGDWWVELDANTEDDAVEKAQQQGGFATNVVGEIRRKDGQLFSTSDEGLLNVLDAVAWTLSFAAGKWVVVDACAGMQKDEVVYQQYACKKASACDRRHPEVFTWYARETPQHLQDVFATFCSKLQDPMWSEGLKQSLSWYIDAHAPFSTTMGKVILLQTALEWLGWIILTQVKHPPAGAARLTESGYNKLPAGQKIIELLKEMGIPDSLPQKVTDLAQFSQDAHSSESEADPSLGPNALTALRNAFVHPKQGHKQKHLRDKTELEALELAAYYVEMVVLKTSGVQGQTLHRFLSRSFHDLRDLPWK